MGRKVFALLILAGCWDQPAGPSGTAKLTLRNQADRSIFVFLPTGGFGETAWSSVLDENGATIGREFDPCRMLDCDDPNAEPRACTLAEPLPRIRELAPGEEIEDTWDGYMFQLVADESCFEKVGAEGSFEVRFCWGHSKTSDFSIGLMTCETKKFTLDGDTEIRQVIDDIPPELMPPGAITFRLENRRSTDIWLPGANDCSFSTRWLTLETSSGAPIGRFANGTVCGSDNLPRPGIGAGGSGAERPSIAPPDPKGGGAACAAPMAQSLPPGQPIQDRWDGLLWELNDQEGCFEQKSGLGRAFTARVCFGDASLDDFSGGVTNETCQTQEVVVQSTETTVVVTAD